jgi:hypothetical protein
MSLSTQLARGTLALPMLSLFALLAVAAGQSNGALPADMAQVEMTAPSVCSLPPKPVLVLAQAPADLGQLAIRSGHGCRA